MERRIGVHVCHCGTNIAATVDVKKVTEYAQSLDSVVVARHYEFMCSDQGKSLSGTTSRSWGKAIRSPPR